MSSDTEVRNASEQFYRALNEMANGDAGQLAGIWSNSPEVTTMHPIGGREVGWDAVRGSFQGVADNATEGRIELSDQIIHLVGDLAYELGVERGHFKLAGQPVDIEQRVTNIYRRVGGAWKIVHHHTDLSPSMLEVLKQLK
jgi:ketosteroid isomerase-like protein